jgi:hypothetical protein
MRRKYFLRTATLAVVLAAIASCGGGNSKAVNAVKKGHFDAAPNITVEELAQRYQYVDPKSVKWELITDANKNEFVKVSSRFNGEALIIFAGVRERVNAGEADVSVLVGSHDAFFKNLFWTAGGYGNDGSIEFKGPQGLTGQDVANGYFEPDYGDGSSPVYFGCEGGELSIFFTVDTEGRFAIKDGSIVFNMSSPVYGDDTAAKYDLIINFTTEADINCLLDMLVNNSDFLKSSGSRL